MIDSAGMMSALLDSCPGFGSTYAAFLAEWHHESEKPYYLALADFSRYLIARLEAGDRQQLDAAFQTIERLHTEGDHYVREAATIGILESLQNTHLHESTNPQQFVAFLRPVSLRYWRKVEDFWSNGTVITDD